MPYSNSEKSDPQAPASYMTIDSQLNRKSVKNKHRRIFFSFLLGLSLLVYLLYFVLPCFHLSSLSATGLVDLETTDLISLSGSHSFSPLLFVDDKKIEDAIVDNSGGIVLSCNVKASPFSIRAEVEEDHPVAFVSSVGYLTSGKTLEEAKSLLSTSLLSEERKSSLSSALDQYRSTKLLPEVHFPVGVSFSSLENKSSAFLALAQLKRTALNEISYVQYLNQTDNATWNNVCDVFLRGKNDRIYRIKHVLYDQMESIFNNSAFPNDVKDSIESYIAINQMQEESYTFLDEEKTISVYSFSLSYVNGKTKIYTEDSKAS